MIIEYVIILTLIIENAMLFLAFKTFVHVVLTLILLVQVVPDDRQ